ncbi:MAG: glutamine synthetase [Clostridia bacterium]|nr:glutamine synthetase [Clostridia bacterium]
MLYVLKSEGRTIENIKRRLLENPQIKFVSLVAVDLGNNHTDERIPMHVFLDNVEKFLKEGVQTDGSSVALPIIAEINDAKVDLIPDKDVNWFVDYNYGFIDKATQLPTGTLLIPATLIHNETYCDSRSILKAATTHFETEILSLLKEYPDFSKELDITIDEVEEVVLTTATELEFWVKSPDSRAEENLLSVSQVLKEQYWKRTVGAVRSAMEESLLLLDYYGFDAEMAHKEVGGVPSKLAGSNKFSHVMEQLEIDWKFSTAIQTADHELFARDIITDCFSRHGLDVTFKAKPIEGVAGSGEHHHIGAALKLKNGKTVNLFSPLEMDKHFLNRAGYGAIMGLLRNYDVINPFVTASNDAFNRLKPGFEAPVCVVTSLGHSPENPSRNRTVLAGLVRDMTTPLATRFELRAPNPLTNTYLCTAAVYQGMLHGIKAVITSGKSLEEIENNFNKKAGEEAFYLDTDRMYRSEEDVFEDYSEEERDLLFGAPPKTVWENIKRLKTANGKLEILKAGNVFTDRILASYIAAIQSNWTFELENRILIENMDLIRETVKIHEQDAFDLDVVNWESIQSLRTVLMKDSMTKKSLFTKIIHAIQDEDYDLVSELQVEMHNDISKLKRLYANYKRNLF